MKSDSTLALSALLVIGGWVGSLPGFLILRGLANDQGLPALLPWVGYFAGVLLVIVAHQRATHHGHSSHEYVSGALAVLAGVAAPLVTGLAVRHEGATAGQFDSMVWASVSGCVACLAACEMAAFIAASRARQQDFGPRND